MLISNRPLNPSCILWIDNILHYVFIVQSIDVIGIAVFSYLPFEGKREQGKLLEELPQIG